jgi:drug/metabolite transporter (DMT)-like permease
MGAYTGEIASALSAWVWVVALILFRKAGERVEPLALNLFKNVLPLPLAAVGVLVVGAPWMASPDAGWTLGLMTVSSLSGMVLGDVLMLGSLNRVGAGWSAVVNSAYSPAMVLVTWALFGVPLTWGVGLGVALVTGAILLSQSREGSDGGRPSPELVKGLVMGLAAQFLMVFGTAILKYPILGQPSVLNTEDPFAVTFWRILISSAILSVWVGARSDRGRLVESIKPSAGAWKWMVPGALLGTYFSLVIWFIGMRHIGDSLVRAAVLNQSGLILLPFLGWRWLGERLTLRKVIASVLAFTGAMIVALSG